MLGLSALDHKFQKNQHQIGRIVLVRGCESLPEDAKGKDPARDTWYDLDRSEVVLNNVMLEIRF